MSINPVIWLSQLQLNEKLNLFGNNMDPELSEPGKLDKIISRLNERQKEAVLYGEGPIVVFAGAGSGKTRVITARIAALLESGIPPRAIVAMTFTNKAAREMKERVVQWSPIGHMVTIGTFHSLCARWLREFANDAGFTSSFTIYDDSDQKSAMKKVLEGMGLLEGRAAPKEYLQAVGKAKLRGLKPGELEEQSHLPHLPKVYKHYQELLAHCNAMDFNDLLMNMLLLLEGNNEVRAILQKRYEYVMVDEYQDTNLTQAKLISLIIGPKRNLLVVGDDDQSIYSWRGAKPTNILQFKDRYRGAKVVRLEQNYRCTGNIVGAANALIQNNKQRVEKKLWTDNVAGVAISFHQEHDASLESFWVTEQIKAELGRYGHEEIAVFYRINAQSRQLEESFRRQQIPYRIYGALRFYDRSEIKDLLAYFRLIVNPTDDVAFRRVINLPTRGIGKKSIERIEEFAAAAGQALYPSLPDFLKQNPALAKKITAFYDLVAKLNRKLRETQPSEMLSELIAGCDYAGYLEKKHPDSFSDRLANVHELGAALSEYESANPNATVEQWLSDVSLVGSEEQSETGVSLMTLHSAKGLEFKRVFIVGVEEGLIPHSQSANDATQLEEERRLLYVGITRAKERLSMVAAMQRRIFTQDMVNPPSRFLSEIPSEFLDSRTQKHLKASAKPKRFDAKTVFHPSYGRGTLKRIENEFGISKAVVDFRDFGVRKVQISQLRSSPKKRLA